MNLSIFTPMAILIASVSAQADPSHAAHNKDAIVSKAAPDKVAAFDILAAHVHRKGSIVTFHMTTNGVAGSEIPEPVGSLGGAPAATYVWPTSLDPAMVGFDEGAGILSMVAATHPDFDDTPLFDENLDGDLGNDGGLWHSHWVVLHPTESCGPGALAVKDIPEGATPNLPVTWPGLPILLDSPGYTPVFDGPEVKISVPIRGSISGASYDGVTAALRVNKNVHAPLFCVTDVFDIASGDLSLPGKIK